jgi:uncharacterized phage infection (PIP) family protein YhgE
MSTIFLKNTYYNISRFFNCTSQISMLIITIIHIVQQFVTKFWLHMELMGHGGFFMDEYNPKSIQIKG